MNGMYSNPLMNIGLGILGANRPGTSAGEAIGRGGLLGIKSFQQQQMAQARMQQLAQAQAMAKAMAEREEEERQQKVKQQMLRQQWQQNAGFAPGMPEWAMKTAYSQQFESPDQTSLMQNLAAAGLSPGTEDYRKAMMQAVLKPPVSIQNLPAPPSGYTWKDPTTPQAGLTTIPGGPAEKPSEGQLVAAGFADRMSDALKEITSKEQSGFNPASVAERAPAMISNYLASPEFQTYKAAQEDWVRAKLRKESGAVIGEEEMKREIETYFPQPGDSESVRRRKAKQREIATKAMVRSAGPQYGRQVAKPNKGWSMERID